MRKTRIITILIALIIAALDQVTKFLIVKDIPLYGSVRVSSFFNIVNIHNTGAAFGSLKVLPNLLFIVITMIVIVFLVVLIFKEKNGILSIVYSLIIGGALGNLIDRLTRGYVVDFLDFHISRFHWASFNVADSALSVGMVLVIFIQFIHKGNS